MIFPDELYLLITSLRTRQELAISLVFRDQPKLGPQLGPLSHRRPELANHQQRHQVVVA